MKSIGSALNHSKQNFNNFNQKRKSLGSALNHIKQNFNNFNPGIIKSKRIKVTNESRIIKINNSKSI